MDKLKIVVAGPGAGKTFNLKNEVINCLPNLDRNRFCAVITYTNAATSELRQRISSEIAISPNIFIGTIHSFLIRFIIDPFGHLIGIVPVEKNYIETPLVELHENYGHITQKALQTIKGIDKPAAKEIIDILEKKHLCKMKCINKPFKLNDDGFRINLPLKYSGKENDIIKAIRENCVFNSTKRYFEIKRRSIYLAETLAKNGVVTYDTIVGVSSKIIKTYPSILGLVSNRIQYIFIDEYQDSRLYIHEIFKSILSNNKTDINFFGDPLQEIFMFSYNTSHLKDEKAPKSFIETPMREIQIKYSEKVEPKIVNHRSSEHIVKFINEYFIEVQHKQTSITGNNNIPVYFINNTISLEIFDTYKNLKTKHNIDNIHKDNLKQSKKPFLKDLVLTSDWIDKSSKPKLKDVYKVFNGEFTRLEKGNYRISGILQEVSRCILAVTEVKKKDFINSISDELEYRKLCFEIARCLKSRGFNYEECINSIRKQFQDKFNIIKTIKQADVENALIELSNGTSISLSNNHESCYSSIHSAKGLEATSVISIAYSKNELEKWVNFQEANNNLDDDYRLGYVAFSRARDMLCISCLEAITPAMKNKLESLNIAFCPS